MDTTAIGPRRQGADRAVIYKYAACPARCPGARKIFAREPRGPSPFRRQGRGSGP